MTPPQGGGVDTTADQPLPGAYPSRRLKKYHQVPSTWFLHRKHPPRSFSALFVRCNGVGPLLVGCGKSRSNHSQNVPSHSGTHVKGKSH